jgi:antitoxin VapB
MSEKTSVVSTTPSQLNIKDARTNALVAELATLTRRSKTEAVRLAVEAQLAREKAVRDQEIARSLDRIRTIQARMKDRMRPQDFLGEDDLYDENGLPK